MDEAGISKKERFLAVGGVVVDGDKQLIGVQRHLDRLVKQWIPEPLQNGFVFHATELFQGVKTFKRESWPLERRLQIADALASIPKKHGLRLALGVVDKASYNDRNDLPQWHEASESERAIFNHASAFSACVLGVDQWLRKEHPSEVSVLVAEDNEQARKTIREVIRYQQNKDTKFGHGKDYAKLFPLKRIMEDPLFSPKKPSNVLQIADFWAYVAKKTYEGDKGYARFAEMMRPSLLPAVFGRQQGDASPY